MRYSMQNVKDSISPIKASRDAIWVKLWARPLSYYLTLFLLNRTNITPNMVSMISIFDVVLASVLLCINSRIAILFGFALFLFFIELDCIDGMMARTLKRNSYMGEFYDALGGYTMCAFPLLSLAICANNTHAIKLEYFEDNGLILVAISAIGCTCDVFSRLVYQKYTANEMIANFQNGKPLIRENDSFYEKQNKFSITYFRLLTDRELGNGGLFPPLCFIAYVFNFLDVIVVLYSLYHIFAWITVMLLFCRKATIYDEINRKSL